MMIDADTNSAVLKLQHSFRFWTFQNLYNLIPLGCVN